MRTEITTTYGGVDITYHERENIWKFELRGRERKAESLAKAKEAIDRPDPRPKSKVEPIAGWMTEGWGDRQWKSVTVTSIAASERWDSSTKVWVTCRGSRKKENASQVYAATQANDAIRASIDQTNAEIDKLEEKREKLFTSLAQIDLTAFGKEEEA